MKKRTSLSFLHRKILTILLYLATFVTVMVYWKKDVIALTILIILSLILNIVTKWRLFKPWLIGAILGTLSEIICIKAGAWRYSNPRFLSVPVWLPFVWGNASILFFELAEQWGHLKVINVFSRSRKKKTH